MAKRQILSQDENNYRRMAKQANQRALRLERYLSDHPDAPTTGLELYQFYLRADYGDTRQRFPESPKSLSQEQLQVYSVQLANFLSADLSQVSAVKKYEKLYKKYKELAQQPEKPQREPDDALTEKRVSGIEKKVLKNGEKIESPKAFFDNLNMMYHYKLNKILGYRDVMRIVSSVQNRSRKDIETEIANIAAEMAANRKITYKEIMLRIKSIQVQGENNDQKTKFRR